MAAYAGTYQARLGKMIDTSPPPVWHCPIEAAQTFVAGEFVYRSGGYVVTCADAPNQVFGLAKEAAPQVAGEVAILVATHAVLFKIPVHHTTPGNAVIEITDLCRRAAGDDALCYDLLHVAGTGVWYVAKHVHANDAVEIQQFVDSLGTLNGKVLITINRAVREVD